MGECIHLISGMTNKHIKMMDTVIYEIIKMQYLTVSSSSNL